MYHLITYPAGFGEESYSPFCIKSIWMLNHAGVPWQRTDSNDPRKMPHGKLPVLRVGDKMIHDSHPIADFLTATGADFWGDATDTQRAQGHTLMRMAEEHMYFHLVLDRWDDAQVWPIVREKYFHEVPAFLRRLVTGSIRKQLLRGLHAQGLGRMSLDERAAAIEADLAAITAHLQDGPFLLGEKLTLPDFSVAAVLAAMAASPAPTPLSTRITDDAVLMGYVARVKDAVGSKT